MYALIITFTVNKNAAWQVPLELGSEFAHRLDDKGYMAVAKAAERELQRQIKMAKHGPQGDSNAKSDKKVKA